MDGADLEADEINSIKTQTSVEELCHNLPSVYAQFLQYARELEKDTEPNYDFYIESFGHVWLNA